MKIGIIGIYNIHRNILGWGSGAAGSKSSKTLYR